MPLPAWPFTPPGNDNLVPKFSPEELDMAVFNLATTLLPYAMRCNYSGDLFTVTGTQTNGYQITFLDTPADARNVVKGILEEILFSEDLPYHLVDKNLIITLKGDADLLKFTEFYNRVMKHNDPSRIHTIGTPPSNP